MSGRRTQSESRIASDKSVTDSLAESLDRDLSFESRHPAERDFGNHVYYECDIYLLKQVELSKDEQFSRERIQMLLEKYYNSKQIQYRLYMFDDSMRFERMKVMGRRALHLELRYEDIKRCSTFRSKPQALALCVSFHFGEKRTYELFRCKSLADLNKICDLIDRATQSSSFRLSRHPVVYNEDLKFASYTNNKNRAMSVESVRNSLSRPKSLVRDYSEYSKKTCDEAVGSWRILKQDENKRGSLKEIKSSEIESKQSERFSMHLPNPTSFPTILTKTSARQTVSEYKPTSNDKVIYRESKSLKCGKLPRIKIDRDYNLPFENWENNITYLQIHPIYGPQINERGPIYMYALQL
ncbi:unnamed protein product [Heterobilharzia americana]|nr:unnamed protein product [Heterobilharzia americana]